MYKNLFKHTGLSLERLRSFCLVVEAGGFNKAAGENEYKQSQYSRQIADLEKFFGCSLFLREGRTSKLTLQGKSLLEISKHFFSELELFKTAVSENKINLVISAGHSVINFFLTSDIKRTLQDTCKTVTFKATSTEESIKSLLSYESHFAIVGKKITNKDLEITKLISSPLVMVYSEKYKANFYTGENLEKLAKNPTAILAGIGSYKKNVLSLFKEKNLNVVLEAPYFSALKTYAEHGLAVAYIPEYCVTTKDHPILMTKSFKDLFNITRDLYLVYRKNVVAQNETMKELAGVFKNAN